MCHIGTQFVLPGLQMCHIGTQFVLPGLQTCHIGTQFVLPGLQTCHLLLHPGHHADQVEQHFLPLPFPIRILWGHVTDSLPLLLQPPRLTLAGLRGHVPQHLQRPAQHGIAQTQQTRRRHGRDLADQMGALLPQSAHGLRARGRRTGQPLQPDLQCPRQQIADGGRFRLGRPGRRGGLEFHASFSWAPLWQEYGLIIVTLPHAHG